MISKAFFNHYAKHQPNRQVAYPIWKNVSSVFLLFESEWMELNPEIRTIVQQLQEQDIQVVSWGYLKKDKILSPNLPESRILGPKDFNLIQRPISDVQQFLLHHSFDILFDLTTSDNLRMQYVAMLAQARFKIGAQNSPCYDMVISCKEQASAEFIFQQMMHYLSIIKSADK